MTMKRKLQVFVSSTFTDLIEERQAAVAAILKAGHIPAGMELFNAGDKSQLETIKRWIDESDVYMLIQGGRYGSVDPDSGLSYTEVEYDYAVAAGKPVFAVVIEDEALERKVKAGGSSFLEKDNLNALKAFRIKVLRRISSFFSELKDIKLCVHESLSDFADDAKLKGWVSANEIEDTSILHAELRTLRSENETLKAQITQAEKVDRSRPDRERSKRIADVIDVLKKTYITIPAELNSGGKEEKIDLLSFFIHNNQNLVSGVTNNMNMSDAAQFLFFTVAPKLQIHGLVENEKVAGSSLRRVFVSRFGLEVLAECERTLAQERSERAKKVAASSDTPKAQQPKA
jgi:nucleoside 2-deoxyribosyltransferase